MINITKNKKKKAKFQATSVFKDLVIIAISLILVFILSYFFDIFIFIVKYIEKHPRKIVYIDEVITTFLTLSIAFAVFAWRRWLELKKETTKRIKLQDEIIKSLILMPRWKELLVNSFVVRSNCGGRKRKTPLLLN
jgi:phosphatidylglycerophosphatase A